MNVRAKQVSDTVVEIDWDPVAGQQGYVPTIDGSEILTDGKRHFSGSKTALKARIGMPRDGKPHSYGVNVLGLKEQGSVVFPAPTDPPPVPGGDGAKLAAFAAKAAGTGAKTTGALPRRWTPGDNELLGGWTATGHLEPDAHAIYINGADNVKVADGWCHDMTQGPNRPQVAQIAGGSKNAQVWRVRSKNIGFSSLDHAYYISNASDVLIASCLIEDTYEYPIHIYGGGPVNRVVVANCTIRTSVRGVALAIVQIDTADDILFVNCEFDGGPNGTDYAIRNKLGTNIRAEHCTFRNIRKGFDSKENSSGDVKLLDVGATATADPAWMPALDVYGKPFTRPTVGCVAA